MQFRQEEKVYVEALLLLACFGLYTETGGKKVRKVNHSRCLLMVCSEPSAVIWSSKDRSSHWCAGSYQIASLAKVVIVKTEGRE